MPGAIPECHCSSRPVLVKGGLGGRVVLKKQRMTKIPWKCGKCLGSSVYQVPRWRVWQDIWRYPISYPVSILWWAGWPPPLIWSMEISLQWNLVVWERCQMTKNLLFGDSQSEKLVFEWVGAKMAQLFQIQCWKVIPLLKYYPIFNTVDEQCSLSTNIMSGLPMYWTLRL